MFTELSASLLPNQDRLSAHSND